MHKLVKSIDKLIGYGQGTDVFVYFEINLQILKDAVKLTVCLSSSVDSRRWNNWQRSTKHQISLIAKYVVHTICIFSNDLILTHFQIIVHSVPVDTELLIKCKEPLEDGEMITETIYRAVESSF